MNKIVQYLINIHSNKVINVLKFVIRIINFTMKHMNVNNIVILKHHLLIMTIYVLIIVKLDIIIMIQLNYSKI